MHSKDELNYPWTNPAIKRRSYKIYIFLLIILFFFTLILFIVYNLIQEKQNQFPSLDASKIDLAIRGDIISADNFKVATSEKIYSATINTKSLDVDKVELFINLFSI